LNKVTIIPLLIKGLKSYSLNLDKKKFVNLVWLSFCLKFPMV